MWQFRRLNLILIGGPLIIDGGDEGDDVQVGVVSFGTGCADADYPRVYARVSAPLVLHWIQYQIEHCVPSTITPTYVPTEDPTNFPTEVPTESPTRAKSSKKKNGKGGKGKKDDNIVSRKNDKQNEKKLFD